MILGKQNKRMIDGRNFREKQKRKKKFQYLFSRTVFFFFVLLFVLDMIRGVIILTGTGTLIFEKLWAPIPVLEQKVCSFSFTLHKRTHFFFWIYRHQL